MTRREQVLALLSMLDEWVPGPRLTRLWREGARGAGPSDRYVSDRVESFQVAFVEDRAGGRRRRDGEIRRLEAARLHEAGGTDAGELEQWEASKRALYRSGSFPELIGALERLAAHDLVLFAAVRVVHIGPGEYGDETKRVFGPLVLADADAGVDWLVAAMPQDIRVPARPSPVEVARSLRGARGHRGERARREQDTEIRALVSEGWSLREVGDLFGLSHEQVRTIAKRGEAA